MSKVYRFLGRKGRTTIPFELRAAMELAPNDLLSFQRKGDLLIVKKEKICDDCVNRRNVRTGAPEPNPIRSAAKMPSVPEGWEALSQEEQMQYINMLAANLKRTVTVGAVRR